MKVFFILSFIILSVLDGVAKPEQYFQYLFPKPDSKFISTETTVIFRLNDKWQNFVNTSLLEIEINGEKSGFHPGELILADDHKTYLYKPYQRFALHETVSVDIDIKISGEIRRIQYTFTTSKSGKDQKEPHSDDRCFYESANSLPPTETFGTMSVINGVSVPSDFPRINVDILEETAPGKIFIGTMDDSQIHYIIIFENDGTPYYYKKLKNRSMDFKKQPDGSLSRFDEDSLNCFIVLDEHYVIRDTVNSGHGYLIDRHDLQQLPNGNYLIIVEDPQTVRMDTIIAGGNPNATVIGEHIQEIDQNGNVVFEWRSWDHFNITDALHQNLLRSTIDYVHMNAVALDYDGHIVISSRNLSEVTKINHQTGEIIWRLGGINNQFEWINDNLGDGIGISGQHDVRPIQGKPDHYTIFDNGSYHTPQITRALEFKVDTTDMTVEILWEYRHSPDRFSIRWGNVQRLENGNTHINWAMGNLPKATEVTPEGEIVYEMNYITEVGCYRTFRFEWRGIALVPYLIAESGLNKVTLIFNKFGDKNIREYRIYGGFSSNSDQFIASTSETFINLTELENNHTYYFRVTAVDSNGVESDFSNEEEVFVKFIEPGENLILNGDFSDNTDYWEFTKSSNAVASGIVEDSIYHIKIDSNVAIFSDVQLYQNNLEIIKGRKYVLEFDAWSSEQKFFNVRIRQNTNQFTDYSRIGTVYSTTERKHFEFKFEMTMDSDYSAQIVLECGQSLADLYIDNVSLVFEPTETAISGLYYLPDTYRLYNNYPNPFNPKTKIKYQLPIINDVEVSIYNNLGQKVAALVSERQQAGYHEVEWDASGYASGIYYYILKTGKFRDVKKMILLR